MKGKSLIFLAFAIICAAVILTACNNKVDEGESTDPSRDTGLYIYVTDENGCTILGEDGQPLTEKWITGIVYATDENGNTYTNANGEKVTVKQTRPVLTSVVVHTKPLLDENGNKVTNENGEVVMVPQTIAVTKPVTNSNGQVVTQAVTDSSGNNVTEENGQVVTEPVTEVHTEQVTHIVEITMEHQITVHVTNKHTSPKTTSVLENPDYRPTSEKQTTNAPVSLPSESKIAATKDWLKGFGGSANDKFVKVLSLGSNSFVALGNTESKDGHLANVAKTGFYSFLTKYDGNGKVIWTCSLGSSGHTRMYDFARLSDGSFIAVGESNAKNLGFENPNGTYLAVIAKISADGSVQWYKHIGGSSTDYFVSVAATADGGFVAGGKFLSTDGDFADLGLQGTDAVIAKFNSSGTIQWKQKLGGAANETLRAVAVDPSGNIYAACHSNSKDFCTLSTTSQNVVVAKYSASGSQLWTTIIEGSKTEEVNDIYADANGCVLVGRYASSNGAFTVNRGDYDAYVIHCTADGKPDWIYTYGGVGNDNIHSICKTDFGYAAVGFTASSNRDFADMGNKGGTDGFILSIDNSGTVKHVKALAGTGNDACYDICKLDSKTFIVVGETYATDKDFADITPAAKQRNGTAIVGRYQIY